jgi:hypothetical protein
MEFSDLHKRIVAEGFELVGDFHNAEIADYENYPILKRILHGGHMTFRMIPSYLGYKDPPLGVE